MATGHLWFEIDDFDEALARVEDLRAEIVLPVIEILRRVEAARIIGRSGCGSRRLHCGARKSGRFGR
jgi:hypothetical protein